MSGTTAPSTAPTIRAQFPAPRKETSRPASEPMPAPTTAIMSRFDMRERGGSSGRRLQQQLSLNFEESPLDHAESFAQSSGGLIQ